jgi:hypothetical protein
MEDKLLELKEQFCNWYCPNIDEEIYTSSSLNGEIWTELLCEYCKIEDYIKFIRDEL